ncbi:MAG: hypothetical protein IKQ43_04400 [Treponema sp.]|nr:hypothetical protein [Treponema sp.]
MELDPAYAMSFIGGADGPTSIFIGHGRLGVIGPIVLLAVILVLLGIVIFALVRSVKKQNKICTIIFSMLTFCFASILVAGVFFGIRQYQMQKRIKDYLFDIQLLQDSNEKQKENPDTALGNGNSELKDENEPQPFFANLNVGDTINLRGYFVVFNGYPPNVRFVTDQNEIIGIGMEEWYDDPLVQNILDNQVNAEIIFQTKSIFKYEGSVDIQYYDKPLMCFSVESIEFIDEPDSTTSYVRGKHVKEDYPSSLTWNGTNAQPILDTDSKKNYRTIITEASQLPPDFNGKYKIASFGAGTMAHGSFIINLETGVVTEGPTFEYSLDYSIDSNLIIRNPKEDILNFWKDELVGDDDEIPRWSITEYYLFVDDQLTVIDSGYEF